MRVRVVVRRHPFGAPLMASRYMHLIILYTRSFTILHRTSKKRNKCLFKCIYFNVLSIRLFLWTKLTIEVNLFLAWVNEFLTWTSLSAVIQCRCRYVRWDTSSVFICSFTTHTPPYPSRFVPEFLQYDLKIQNIIIPETDRYFYIKF